MRRSPFQRPAGDYAADVWYLLRDRITDLLSQVASNSAGTTTTTQQVESLLSSIDSVVGNIFTIVNFSNWESVQGNTIEFTYYTGTTADNPSGKANLATKVFKTGATTVFTQTFSYNAADDIVKITTT